MQVRAAPSTPRCARSATRTCSIPGSDPLMAIIGALASLNEGERVVARLLLRSLGPDWAEAHQAVVPHRGPAQQPPPGSPAGPGGAESAGHLRCRGPEDGRCWAWAHWPRIKGYFWVRERRDMGRPCCSASGWYSFWRVGGWAWARWKRLRDRVCDPLQVREKTSRMAFDAEIQVVAILPSDVRPQRARELLEPVAAAYRHYDNPAGARLRVGKITPHAGRRRAASRPAPDCSAPGASWASVRRRPCGTRQEPRTRHRLVARSGARVLLPSSHGVRGWGARGRHHPPESRGRYAFPRTCSGVTTCTLPGRAWVSRRSCTTSSPTRCGRRRRAGTTDAIVVVDPHADLVGRACSSMFRNRSRAGWRLIDPGRSDGVRRNQPAGHPRVRRSGPHGGLGGAGRQGPVGTSGGPRMQSILDHTVKSLHEANRRRAVDDQYTILDGLRLLADENFRNQVQAEMSDPYILQWWGRRLRRLEHQLPCGCPRARADPPLVLCVFQACTGHTRPAALGRSTCAGTILDGRRAAGLDRPGGL